VQKCHDYHEEWINGSQTTGSQTTCKKLVIDANHEIEVAANDRGAEIMQFIDAL